MFVLKDLILRERNRVLYTGSHLEPLLSFPSFSFFFFFLMLVNNLLSRLLNSFQNIDQTFSHRHLASC